jgi:Fe-S-cluster containining protein
VDESDVILWKALGREDILKWVRPRSIGGGDYAYEVWVHPVKGAVMERCPWLKRRADTGRYFCMIHDVKPTICRYFPASRKHAEEVGCGGFEQKVLLES